MERDVPLTLDQPSELVGAWWNPDHRDGVASGRLTFEPGSPLRLDVVGGAHLVGTDDTPRNIHGLPVDGRKVTLRGCSLRNQRINVPGGMRTEADASQAFVGMHAHDEAGLLLTSLEARVARLPEWLESPAIDLTQGNFPRSGPIDFRTVGYLGLAKVTGGVLGTYSELTGSADGKSHAHRLTLEERAWLHVGVRRLRHYDDLLSIVERLRRLISLGAGAEAQMLELKGEAVVIEQKHLGTEQLVRAKRPVWILSRLDPPRESPPIKPSEMLFRRSDTARYSNLAITRWVRDWDIIKPTVDLYLTAQPRTGLYAEFRFLAIAQALEALHARISKSNMTLRERLAALVAALPRTVRNSIAADFIDLLVATRNYLTHWNPKKQAAAATGSALWGLTELAKIVFEATILRILGFRQNHIAHLIGANPRIRRTLDAALLAL